MIEYAKWLKAPYVHATLIKLNLNFIFFFCSVLFNTSKCFCWYFDKRKQHIIVHGSSCIIGIRCWRGHNWGFTISHENYWAPKYSKNRFGDHIINLVEERTKNGLNSSMQNSTVGSGQQYFVSGFTEELAFIFQILVRFGSVRRKN